MAKKKYSCFEEFLDEQANVYCQENGLNYEEWRNSEEILDFASIIEEEYYNL